MQYGLLCSHYLAAVWLRLHAKPLISPLHLLLLTHTLPLPVPSPLRGAFLLQLLCDYSERLGAMLDGRHVELTTRQLSGGARVRHVFQELLGRSLRELQPVRGISDEEICTVIKNGAGVTGEGQGGGEGV